MIVHPPALAIKCWAYDLHHRHNAHGVRYVYKGPPSFHLPPFGRDVYEHVAKTIPLEPVPLFYDRVSVQLICDLWVEPGELIGMYLACHKALNDLALRRDHRVVVARVEAVDLWVPHLWVLLEVCPDKGGGGSCTGVVPEPLCQQFVNVR